MTTHTRLEPPIRLRTPRGPADAYMLIDYGRDSDVYLWVAHRSDGTLFVYRQRDVTLEENLTEGTPAVEPAGGSALGAATTLAAAPLAASQPPLQAAAGASSPAATTLAAARAPLFRSRFGDGVSQVEYSAFTSAVSARGIPGLNPFYAWVGWECRRLWDEERAELRRAMGPDSRDTLAAFEEWWSERGDDLIRTFAEKKAARMAWVEAVRQEVER